jgi:hypothetical protein
MIGQGYLTRKTSACNRHGARKGTSVETMALLLPSTHGIQYEERFELTSNTMRRNCRGMAWTTQEWWKVGPDEKDGYMRPKHAWHTKRREV